MENKNSHTNNDTFLAQWLEGALSDTELKNRISDQDYNAFIKLRKALEVSDKLNASTKDSFIKIQEKIANKRLQSAGCTLRVGLWVLPLLF